LLFLHHLLTSLTGGGVTCEGIDLRSADRSRWRARCSVTVSSQPFQMPIFSRTWMNSNHGYLQGLTAAGTFTDVDEFKLDDSKNAETTWVVYGTKTVSDCNKSTQVTATGDFSAPIDEAETQEYSGVYSVAFPSAPAPNTNLEDAVIEKSHQNSYSSIPLTLSPQKKWQGILLTNLNLYQWAKTAPATKPYSLIRRKCKISSISLMRRFKTNRTVYSGITRTKGVLYYGVALQETGGTQIPHNVFLNPPVPFEVTCRPTKVTTASAAAEYLVMPPVVAPNRCSKGTSCCP
jgi:hypothetical protein